MALSLRTIQEMTAGAEALARLRGDMTPEEEDLFKRLLEGATNAAERMIALRKMEREGLVFVRTVHLPMYVSSNSPSRTVEHYVLKKPSTVLWHEGRLPKVPDDAAIMLTEDPIALMCGGYPSEVLFANIVLAIASMPKETDNG